MARTRFRLLRVRSPLLAECLFLRVLRCFSSPGALHLVYVFNQGCSRITSSGLLHSETVGSSFASNSPTLIAGSRVLLRHLVPRHPPWTLSSLPRLHPLLSPLKRGPGSLSLARGIQSFASAIDKDLESTYSVDKVLVEMTGLEPVTPCVQSRCSPS